MANSILESSREKFLGGTLDWDGMTISAALLDLNTAETAVAQISSSTNATPIVVTATAHGFSNGDIVYIGDHAGNLSGNGVWQITGVSTNTFSLTDPITGSNAVGSGVGTATGYAVNLGPSSSSGFYNKFGSCQVGSKVNLTGCTITQGVADANDVTFTSVSGASVEAVMILRDTGNNSTSEAIALITGRHIVTCAATTAASATVIPVERLNAGIASGQALAFSNGATATLSSAAAAGDRTITVSALAATITAGSRALANANGSGLPVTPNGGNLVITWDNGPSKIFKL